MELMIDSFFIYNADFGPTEETEHEKLLFHFPSHAPLNIQIRHIGLVQALVSFTRQFKPDGPCESLSTQKKNASFLEPETGYFMCLFVNMSKSRKADSDEIGSGKTGHSSAGVGATSGSVGGNSNGNDNSSSSSSSGGGKGSNGVTESASSKGKSIVNGTAKTAAAQGGGSSTGLITGALSTLLKQSYDLFRLCYGDFAEIVNQRGVQHLRELFGRFFPIYLQSISFSDLSLQLKLDGIDYVQLEKAQFLKVRSLVSLIKDTFQPLQVEMILQMDGSILWSDLLAADTLKMLHFTRLLRLRQSGTAAMGKSADIDENSIPCRRRIFRRSNQSQSPVGSKRTSLVPVSQSTSAKIYDESQNVSSAFSSGNTSTASASLSNASASLSSSTPAPTVPESASAATIPTNLTTARKSSSSQLFQTQSGSSSPYPAAKFPAKDAGLRPSKKEGVDPVGGFIVGPGDEGDAEDGWGFIQVYLPSCGGDQVLLIYKSSFHFDDFCELWMPKLPKGQGSPEVTLTFVLPMTQPAVVEQLAMLDLSELGAVMQGDVLPVAKSIAEVKSRRDSETPFGFLYFNQMALAVQSTGMGKFNALNPQIQKTLEDMHLDLVNSMDKLGEVCVRMSQNVWIYGQRNNGKEIYIVVQKKEATLVEVHDDVRKLCAARFRDIFVE